MEYRKCNNCGNTYSEDEIYWKEFVVGEYEGHNCYDEEGYCPYCNATTDDSEEVYPCELCGEYHTEDELVSGVCQECLDKCKNNLKLCKQINNGEKEKVEIDFLLTTLFTPEQIENILYKTLADDVDCSEFIDWDMNYAAERLLEIKSEKSKEN